jgi:NADPH2:quinone reductase
MLPAPAAFDDATASAFVVAYHTAWFGLYRRAGLRVGETLLVHAAAGGTGSAAVQLGRLAGARVIAVVGSAEKAEVARDLGADLVIDRTRDDVIAAVKEATGEKGVDVIYDPVGGQAYTASTKVVAFEGRIIVVGFASGTIPKVSLNHALVKNYSILGLHWGLYRTRRPELIRRAHDELMTLAAADVVRPLVSRRLAFDEAPAGLAALAAGDTIGRVTVAPPQAL